MRRDRGGGNHHLDSSHSRLAQLCGAGGGQPERHAERRDSGAGALGVAGEGQGKTEESGLRAELGAGVVHGVGDLRSRRFDFGDARAGQQDGGADFMPARIIGEGSKVDGDRVLLRGRRAVESQRQLDQRLDRADGILGGCEFPSQDRIDGQRVEAGVVRSGNARRDHIAVLVDGDQNLHEGGGFRGEKIGWIRQVAGNQAGRDLEAQPTAQEPGISGQIGPLRGQGGFRGGHGLGGDGGDRTRQQDEGEKEPGVGATHGVTLVEMTEAPSRRLPAPGDFGAT